MKYPQGEKQHLISEIVTLKINNWTSSNKSTFGQKNHHPPSVAIPIVTVSEINLNSEGDCVCFNNSYLDVKYMVCMQIRLYLHGTPLLLPRSHKMQQSDWLIQDLTIAIPRQIHLEI